MSSIGISSFRKREKQSVSSVVGTKISATTGNLIVSTGIPSLDNIIDGGLPLGSLCLIEEDEYGSYAKIICKYFLAEGAVKQNYLFGASANENPWDLLNSLPTPVATSSAPASNNVAENKEELKIAWRYENLSLESNTERCGVAFDLSSQYELSKEQKDQVLIFNASETLKEEGRGSLKNAKCLNMIKSVDEAIKKWNLDLNSNPGNLLRIVISSFGSSYWELEEKRPSDFTSTLLLLKALTRSANAVTVVTIPHQLLDEVLIGRSRGIADIVIGMKSLREDPHLQDLMDVHGILEVKKMTNLTSLKPLLAGQDGTTTYGFKATKRKFKIEKLHLPPAMEGDKVDTEQPSSSSCGSSNTKNNLDF